MTTTKNTPLKRGDLPTPVTGGAGVPLQTASAPAVLPDPIAPAPFGLVLIESGFDRDDAAASAYVRLEWKPGQGTPDGASYELQHSTAADFSATPLSKTIYGVEGTQRGLQPLTPYFFRVRAVINGLPGKWSAALSVTVGAESGVPPAAPSDLAYTWSGQTGAVILTCTPASSTTKTIRYRIFTADPGSGGTLLRTAETASGLFVWTLDMQRDDRGIPDGPLPNTAFVIATAISWSGAESADLTLAISRPPPAAPAGFTHTWVADAGLADETLIATWTAAGDVLAYRMTVDGVVQPDLPANVGRFVYGLFDNAQQHAGVPDPVLSLSLVGVDALGQVSTAATATATNVAPPATTIVALRGIAGVVALRITAVAAADLRGYRVRVYKDGGELTGEAFETTDSTPVYDAQNGDGAYQFSVAAVDYFGQYGTESTLTVALDLEDLTIEVIRAGVTYTDSDANDPDGLVVLKDDVRDAGGILYGSGAVWSWTEADRQFPERVGAITVAGSAGLSGYIGLSLDQSQYRWYAGPLVGANTLTFIGTGPVGGATELAARLAPVAIPASQAFGIPGTVEARYIRLGHTGTADGSESSAPPVAGYALWLDVQRAGTLFQDVARTTAAGVGDPVGSWYDPDQDIAAEATLTARPTRGSDGLVFDGVNDRLTSALAPLVGTSNYTAFIVASYDADNASQRFLLSMRTGNLGNPLLQLYRPAGRPNGAWINRQTPNAADGVEQEYPSMTLGTPYVWATRSGAAGNTIYRSGLSPATTPRFGETAFTAETMLRLGVDFNADFAAATIRAVLLYPAALSDTGRAAVAAWLATRHGVSGEVGGSSYTLNEFYPRAKVVADDFIGENFTGINITGSTINGGFINGTVITGATFQTAEEGARTEIDIDGLRTYDSLGNVQVEATTATDGALRAGAGKVLIDRFGLQFLNANLERGSFDANDFTGLITDGGPGVELVSEPNSTLPGEIWLRAKGFEVSEPSHPANVTLRLKGKTATAQPQAEVNGIVKTFGLDVGGFAGQPAANEARINTLYISNGVGFYGATPTTLRPTITGSRGGNAALAALLTTLATLGLITDGTGP